MNQQNLLGRTYKKILALFLLIAGFFIIFFTVSRSREAAMGASGAMLGVAHADVPTSSAASGGGDSGDDGGGDSGDSGGK